MNNFSQFELTKNSIFFLFFYKGSAGRQIGLDKSSESVVLKTR